MKRTPQKKKIPRGREGGRKGFLKDPKVKRAWLEQETIDFYTTLGGGNFSQGVRMGQAIIQEGGTTK